MHESTTSNPPKRPRSATALSPTGRYPPACKRRKVKYPSSPPPEFWDRLTEKHLTKRALRELDRRNREEHRVARAPPPPTNRRPDTGASAFPSRSDQATLQSVEEYLSSLTPAQLGQIRHSARFGGPDLSDLQASSCDSASCPMRSGQSSSRGRKRKSVSPPKRSTKSSRTTTTKSTSPYDGAFQQHLIDHGIFPEQYEYPNGEVPPAPDNLEEIVEVVARPRRSLSPSVFTDTDFRNFKRAASHSVKEPLVMSTVIPIIEGNVRHGMRVAGQVPFTNLDPLTDGTLVPGNPDRYFGAAPEQLDKQIRSDIDGLIVPSTQPDLPIVPNFLLAVEGPDGSPAVAKRQASYDGALGARSIQAVQSYGSHSRCDDNNAYTLTSTYQDGYLRMYTSHPLRTSGSGKQPQYVMTQVNAYALTGDIETFRAGVGAYRNGRDWTKQKRDDAITNANKKMLHDSDTLAGMNSVLMSSSTHATPGPLTDSSSGNTALPQKHD